MQLAEAIRTVDEEIDQAGRGKEKVKENIQRKTRSEMKSDKRKRGSKNGKSSKLGEGRQTTTGSIFYVSRPFLMGALLGSVSCIIAWKFLQPPFTADVDVAALNVSLRDTLVAQPAAIGSLVAHLQWAHSSRADRLDFLALGPSGTGKTLLLQTVCESAGVPCWRLVGDIDIGRDLQLLDKLAGKLVKSASRSAWLILAFDHVSTLIPQVAYLIDVVAKAVESQHFTLVTIVTATSSDAAGERGADAERMAFAHAHVLRFKPMRRAEISECIRRYMRDRNIIILDDEVQEIVSSVKYEGQYAVNGCKPAIYQLEVRYDLKGT